MDQEKKKVEEDETENEVALALVAECQVGDKSFKAGMTWTEESDDACKLHICNPGGVVSYLECPKFDEAQAGEKCVRIPGDNKYAYPHCCDYVFRIKNKNGEGEQKEDEKDKEEKSEDREGKKTKYENERTSEKEVGQDEEDLARDKED